MWSAFLFFVGFIISINGLERQVYEQKLSSVDADIISFANASLSKYLHHEENVRPTHILRIKTAVNFFDSMAFITISKLSPRLI